MKKDEFIANVESKKTNAEKVRYILKFLNELDNLNPLNEEKYGILYIIHEARNYLVEALESDEEINDREEATELVYRPTQFLSEIYREKEDEYQAEGRNVSYRECHNVVAYFDKHHKKSMTIGLAQNYSKTNEWIKEREIKRSAFNDNFFRTSGIKLEDALYNNRGGFLERKFGKTSPQFKEIQKVVKEFNDRSSKNYGNYEKLEQVTKAYVVYKLGPISGYNGEGEPQFKEEDINRLGDTAKGRINFCKNLLDSIKLAKKDILEEKNRKENQVQEAANDNVEQNKKQPIDNLQKDVDDNEVQNEELDDESEFELVYEDMDIKDGKRV